MLHIPDSPAATTGSVTRACQNCSKAKAKCAPQDNSSNPSCARCFRLKKECIFPPRLRKKRRSPNAASNAALEEKIESLVNLLSAAPGISPTSETTSPPGTQQCGQSLGSKAKQADEVTMSNRSCAAASESVRSAWASAAQVFSSSEQITPPEGQPRSKPSPSSAGQQPLDARLSDLNWSLTGGSSVPNCRSAWELDQRKLAPAGAPLPSASALNLLPVQDAGCLLSVYREQFAPHFPFINIPDEISAEDFRNQKPWLYRTIMLLAAQEERARQQELGKQLFSDLSCAMLLRGEKNLDMLQSLCVCNLWGYYFAAIPPNCQSSAIFQLGLALLFDLGLNRPVRGDDGPGEILADFMKGSLDGKREIKRTTDERRALLSFYLLGSVSTLCVKRHEGLQHSPYIDYTCQILEEAAEQDSDLVLVSLVKMQRIIDLAYKHIPSNSTTNDIKAPAWMHMKAARTELESYWASVSSKTRQHPLVQISYHSSNLFLYGISVSTQSISSGMGPMHRLDLLYACLLSCQTLLDGFVNTPMSSYFGYSFMDLAHIGHTCSTLLKLSLVEEPGWDLTYVRQTVNAQYYIDQIASKFMQAGAAIDQMQTRACSDSFPTGCGRAMLRVKAWYETKLSAETIQKPLVPQDESHTIGIGDTLSIDQMMLDDAEWVDFMMGNGICWP